MKVRALFSLAVAAGISGQSFAGPPAPLPASATKINPNQTLADDVAYKLARALHKGEAAIARRLDQARETTAANTVAAAPRRDLIHPGVARYLTEAGLLK